jgi:tetratricopeptide (TPR) repeat protein
MQSRKRSKDPLESVIPKLAKAVKLREIPRALGIIDEWIDQLDSLPLSQKSAIALLGYCAWSIDFYGPHLEQLEKAIVRFRQIPPGELTLCDLSHLNVAEGLLKFHREEYSEAKTLFERVKEYADLGRCTELMTISRYYLGRVLWKQTDYENALVYIHDAKKLDVNNGARVAAMELVEGWLHFLMGDIKEAQRVLDHAKTVLYGRVDAMIDLGNILSFQGRLFRESGQYRKALDCFSEAIAYYGKDDPGHRNVARSHLNKAFVYRLLARDLDRKRLSKYQRPQAEAEVQELRIKAFAELNRGREIYEFDKSRHNRGLCKLHSILALLYFDSCEFDRAEEEAEKSYAYGRDKNDKFGMADARIIQSTLALEGHRGIIDAQLALKLAKEAIKDAEQTGHRRLRARAYIRMGLALLERPYEDPIGARRCWEEAQANLVPDDMDYLRASLAALEKGILSKQHSSSLISRLTVADIEGCTLEEINTEVEETVIRSVYERLGRNIFRTAKELKTGARKVRKAVTIFKITEATLQNLKDEGVDSEVLKRLASVKNRETQGQARLLSLLKKVLGSEPTDPYKSKILRHAHKSIPLHTNNAISAQLIQ